MAFNLGAFAGALGQSALSTYERLGEAGLRNIQKQQLIKDIAEKEALDQAWRQSQARVGQTDDYTEALKTGSNIGTEQARMLSNQGALPGATAEDQAFERASAEAAAGAMRENAVRQGAIPVEKAALPVMKPAEFTKAQGMEDYVKAAGQISRKGTVEAIQLKQIVRQSENEDKFFKRQEKFNNDLATIRGTLESFGMKGIFDLASKNGMKDIKFVEGKNGIGSRVQILGPKGDVLETISDPNVAADRLSEFVTSRFLKESASFLGSPKDVVAYMQGERKVRAAEMSAQADVEYKGKGGVIDRAYQTGARGGAGGGSGTTERILAKAEEMSKDKNSKFFGKKEQAYEFLKRGFNRDEDALAWDKIEVKLRSEPGVKPEEIAAQRADFFRTRGYAPPVAVQALRTGVNPVTKKPLTEKELSDFNRTYPKTPWQDILGTDTPPLPPSSTQIGGIPVPR